MFTLTTNNYGRNIHLADIDLHLFISIVGIEWEKIKRLRIKVGSIGEWLSNGES